MGSEQRNFKFWNTQPVPKLDEEVTENTFIDPAVPVDQIQQHPYALPAGFQWTDVDLNDNEQLEELFKLLSENYVEDDDNMFRFAYSPEFLRWALLPPGWKSEWHCGVRAGANHRLVAFIGAIPCNLKVYDKDVKAVEINFLCVLKKLRSHRMAPVLIKEITRRVHLQGIFQAAFTAGIIIPKPIARCRYYHRTLNPKKLIDTGFSALQPKMTLARTIKLYKLPEETSIRLVQMREIHVKSAYN
uniref:Glycylpeptide N-tetradecanoyltransferase n=1 Tax=Panagrolaimus sp. JU765 TaxID=591449 RepID=A0AC34Q1A1_9BILA